MSDDLERQVERFRVGVAFLCDAAWYSDGYGVQGSDFLCCHFCGGGGAPNVPAEHTDDCPVKRWEEYADEHWEEMKERAQEVRELASENARLRTELAQAREALVIARDFIDSSAFNVPTKDYYDAVTKTLVAALTPHEREGEKA